MNNQPQTQGGFFTIAAWQKANDLTVKIYQTTQIFLPQERYGLNLPDATLGRKRGCKHCRREWTTNAC